MAPTSVKSVRLLPEEVARLNRLWAYFPEASSEADLLKLVTMRGLLMLEAEVAAAGGGVPKGYSEEALATLILPRVLTTLTWLAQMGRLPGLISMPQGLVSGERGDHTRPAELEIDPDAADDIAALGGDFL